MRKNEFNEFKDKIYATCNLWVYLKIIMNKIRYDFNLRLLVWDWHELSTTIDKETVYTWMD